MRPWHPVLFVLLLSAGCGGPDLPVGKGASALSSDQQQAPAASCEAKQSEVLYLGSCQIQPGGIYTETDSRLRCQVVSASSTTVQGQPACREVRSCVSLDCTLPSASFSQAPMQGTAAPESFNPNMIGD